LTKPEDGGRVLLSPREPGRKISKEKVCTTRGGRGETEQNSLSLASQQNRGQRTKEYNARKAFILESGGGARFVNLFVGKK